MTPSANKFLDKYNSDGFLKRIHETIRQTKSNIAMKGNPSKKAKQDSNSSSCSDEDNDDLSHRKKDKKASSSSSVNEFTDSSDTDSKDSNEKKRTNKKESYKNKTSKSNAKDRKKSKKNSKKQKEKSPMQPELIRMLEGLNSPLMVENSSNTYLKKNDSRPFTSPISANKTFLQNSGGHYIRIPSFGHEFKTNFVENPGEAKTIILSSGNFN